MTVTAFFRRHQTYTGTRAGERIRRKNQMLADGGTQEENESSKGLTCARLGKKAPPGPPACLDPKAYCKHRTACPIFMLEKGRKREEKRDASKSSP